MAAFLSSFLSLCRLMLAIASLIVSLYLRKPFMASVRTELLWLILAISMGLLIVEIARYAKGQRFKRSIRLLVIGIACSTIAIAVTSHVKFNLTKRTVLHTNPTQLEALGQHFIVGYRQLDELQELVSKRAIGGVFITSRNIKGKTKDEIRHEIKTLQTIRQTQNLPPLWIATDQEGGAVSRLSPPLTQLPLLSTIVDGATNIEDRKADVIRYAETHGRELSDLGINLNFAPVVDLNKGIVNPNDKFSQIYRRAIATDKDTVEKVALWYCQTLELFDVWCTLKHFPGLGGVATDTHVEDSELTTPVDELAQNDWVPFRETASRSNALIMLSHARLTALDAQHPVSFSKPIVSAVIRNSWRFDGVLVTDDFSMQAVYGSKDGLANATIKALNASVDLVLVSFDQDLYYEAMAALLRAERSGKLDKPLLQQSKERLARHLTSLE